MQDRGDEEGGTQQTAPGRSIGAYRNGRGVTHLLHASRGRLWDRNLSSGREGPTPLAADELVLTPTNKVLVTLLGEELTRSSLLRDGSVAPFRERVVRVSGARRLLAARVTMTDVVEALVTTDDQTLLVRLPSGRVLTRWPFPAMSAVGQTHSILIWPPGELADSEYEADSRIVPGSAVSADAGAVATGMCIAALTEGSLHTSWETEAGFSTRVLSVSGRTVAVVRAFGPDEEPHFVVMDSGGVAHNLAWQDLRPEGQGDMEPGADEPLQAAASGRPDDRDGDRPPSVFMSYAHDDSGTAHASTGSCCPSAVQAGRVVQLLRSLRIPVFWDRDILPGQTWGDEIGHHFDEAAVVLVLWGNGSVQRWDQRRTRGTLRVKEPGQVVELKELWTKLFSGGTVIPLLMPGLDPETLPPTLRARQALTVGSLDAEVSLANVLRPLAGPEGG